MLVKPSIKEMKKKNGYNLMLFVFIIDLFMILSCSKSYKTSSSGILIRTDSTFSAMSVKEGTFKAFLSFIADNGVILRDNSYPAKGRETLRRFYSGKSDTSFILSWQPVHESMAKSGETGYTYGIWTSTDKFTKKISKGTYITIWEKQKDGSWKFVLDTGTQGLPDEPK